MATFGAPTPRTEDVRILVGKANYVSNIDIPGAAYVTYVPSPIAHGRLISVDVTAARAMPGVLGAYSAADLDIGPYPLGPVAPAGVIRPLLATGTVRFVGEPVAAIVSETRESGEDAAAMVEVDIEPLPAVIDLATALDTDVLLFPDAGSNLISSAEDATNVPANRAEDCEVVVRASYRSSRVAPCPLETRAAAARWEPDGRLVHWSACQGPHPIRETLAALYGMALDDVRVITPDVGGSFGAKARPSTEEVVLPWLAARVGRPVRWLPDRSDDMVGTGHSRAQLQQVTLGGHRDGTLEVLHIDVLGDACAYPLACPILARASCEIAPGVYRIPHVSWRARTAATNTTPIAAYRGAGRPEGTAATERTIDLFAVEIGMDPAELRRRNLVRTEDFPYKSATGLVYDSGDYAALLERALIESGYDALRAEQARRRGEGTTEQLGIGVAMFLDRSAGIARNGYCELDVDADGRLLVRTSATAHGQGHATAWAMLAAEGTGFPTDQIEIVAADTDLIRRGSYTGGSESLQRVGSAVVLAVGQLIEQAKEIAAGMLGVTAADVVLDSADGGRFSAEVTPGRVLGWAELAAAAPAGLCSEAEFMGEATFPSGAYVALVEVDTETGRVRVARLITVDDAGRVLNPLLAEGQIHGGASQGIGQAIQEEFLYDEDGNPLTTNFADYAVVSAPEVPMFETFFLETVSPNNPLGARGIGESGAIGAPAAVQNAVVDALRPLGVSHLDMPCTPLRVWQAIQAAAAARKPA